MNTTFRDRQLGNTIQSVGIGIAVGTISVGVLASTYQVIPDFITEKLQIDSDDKWNQSKNNDSIFLFAFSTTIFMGFFLRFFAFWFTKWILDSFDKIEQKRYLRKAPLTQKSK